MRQEMRKEMKIRLLMFVALIASATILLQPSAGYAASAAEIDANVDKALADLYAKSSEAKVLSQRAKGILVFPRIIKGGFIVGAQGGTGALRKNGKTSGYYSSVAVSYGLQIGVQWFGYALFFMNDSALEYLNKSGGWEIGTGPSIVAIETGAANNLSTTTSKEAIYAFTFGQKGLMAGIALQGTKVTKYTPDK